MAAGFSPVIIRKYTALIECAAVALVFFDISVYDTNHIFQDRRFDLRKMRVRAVFARNRLPFPIFPLLLHHSQEHGRLKSSIIFFFLFIYFFFFFSPKHEHPNEYYVSRESRLTRGQNEKPAPRYRIVMVAIKRIRCNY